MVKSYRAFLSLIGNVVDIKGWSKVGLLLNRGALLLIGIGLRRASFSELREASFSLSPLGFRGGPI